MADRSKKEYRILDVDSYRQLLFDDAIIESKVGFKTTMNPALRTEGPVLVPEKPWEMGGVLGRLGSVFTDGNIHKMWYGARDSFEGGFRLCYATSEDGINWKRPNLGVISHKGSKKNNIVFEPTFDMPKKFYHPGNVFKDPTALPERRYKHIYGDTRLPHPEREYTNYNFVAAYSPDGINWTPSEKRPIIPWYTDTMSVCFWDNRIEKYILYVRWNEGETYKDDIVYGFWEYRAIGRSESEDFENFPPPIKIMEPDTCAPQGMKKEAYPVRTQRQTYNRLQQKAWMDLYHPGAVKYPYAENAYFMFLSPFYHKPDTIDVQLATSRDGVHFTLWSQEPFLRLGPEGSFDSKQIHMEVGMIKMKDEIWMYYGGKSVSHDDELGLMRYGRKHKTEENAEMPTGIGRIRIRLDGFVSQDATRTGGSLTTLPIKFSGEHLYVNMDGSAGGWLKVEILDNLGNPISGFSEQQSDQLWGNDVNKLVKWEGKSSLKNLQDKTIKLRFIGQSVKVYAFQFH